MLVCPKCHASVRETANFCDNCGHPFGSERAELRVASPADPQDSAAGVAPGTCSSCGYLNVLGEMFCQNCGVQLAPVASAPPPPPVPVSLQGSSPAQAQPPRDGCPDCGYRRAPDDVFCQNCGARLDPADFAPPGQPAQPVEPTTLEERPGLAFQLVVSASHTAIVLDMHRDEWLIGRSDPLRAIFPEIDLGPHGGDKSGVSRRHARLVAQAGQCLISDLNSTNFTFLNEEKLQPGVLYPLKHGDEIRFGLLALKYFEQITG